MTDFKKHILSDATKAGDLLNKVDYSSVPSIVYREVAKRFKLWGVEAQRGHFKNDKFDLFINFIKRGLDFLAIRETPELFRSINEFYNAILKQEYFIALNHTR